MARTVHIPEYAKLVAYAAPFLGEAEVTPEMFQAHVADLTKRLLAHFPSLSEAPRTIDGGEGHILARNDYVEFGYSEYMGLFSIWAVVAKDSPDPAFSIRWCDEVRDGFLDEFAEFNRIGSFSNGEAVFERRQARG